VRFYAGDVTGETYFINATDALRIQKHFVYGTAFDREPWTFWETGKTISSNTSPSDGFPIVTVGGANKTANMYGLCTGDFNRSFTPAKKSTSSDLILNYANTIQVSANQVFDLPIRIVNPSKIGAVSLILNFPAEYMDVMDVLINGVDGQLDWNINGNELRIGWNSSVPANLGALDNLLTLHLKATDAFKKGKSIRITLAADPLNELANEIYDVIPNSELNVDVVEASAYGVDEHSAGNGISMYNYPNPFAKSTTIAYTLPFTGNVILEIHSLLGNTLNTLVSEIQSQGDHDFKFDASNLAPGVYTATIRLSNKTDEAVKTVKFVISR
jgi:hypothetical protein